MRDPNASHPAGQDTPDASAPAGADGRPDGGHSGEGAASALAHLKSQARQRKELREDRRESDGSGN